MAKLWVWLVGQIPIKSGSRNAQIRNLRIWYADIYENAIVQTSLRRFFILSKRSVHHGDAVSMTRCTDSNQIGLSKCSNPKPENFACWYLRKWHSTEITYAIFFFYRKAAYVTAKLWVWLIGPILIKSGTRNTVIRIRKFRMLIFTKMPLHINFVRSFFFVEKHRTLRRSY